MKRPLLLFVLAFFFVVFCVGGFVRHRLNNNSLSINVSENADMYRIQASYNRHKTYMVQRYIDRQLNAHHLFDHARTDADFTLDNEMNVYVKTSPGNLLIKMDKSANSYENYCRLKQLGNDLKMRLTGNY